MPRAPRCAHTTFPSSWFLLSASALTGTTSRSSRSTRSDQDGADHWLSARSKSQSSIPIIIRGCSERAHARFRMTNLSTTFSALPTHESTTPILLSYRQRGGSYVLVQPIAHVPLSPRDRDPTPNQAQTARSDDEKEAADWSGDRVASTPL